MFFVSYHSQLFSVYIAVLGSSFLIVIKYWSSNCLFGNRASNPRVGSVRCAMTIRRLWSIVTRLYSFQGELFLVCISFFQPSKKRGEPSAIATGPTRNRSEPV